MKTPLAEIIPPLPRPLNAQRRFEMIERVAYRSVPPMMLLPMPRRGRLR